MAHRSNPCIVLSILITALCVCFSCAYKHERNIPKYYHETFVRDSVETVLQQDIDIDSVNLELLEWAIFDETNMQRKRLGLSTLTFDSRLQRAARLHSKEMIDLGYFEHRSPRSENETVRKRIENEGIAYGFTGENIAVHPVHKVQEVVFQHFDLEQGVSKYAWRNAGTPYTYREFAVDLVSRWLNSPEHRTNLLAYQFQYLGVGCALAKYRERDVFYVTQNFSSTNY